MVLYGTAALFAVSGIGALPSGNITGGVGCLAIAVVCALFGKKGNKETTEKKTIVQRNVTAVSVGGKIVETIRTKVVGVTFENEDGENRQDILSGMSGDEEIEIEKYTYNGEPAAYVKCGDKILGSLSAELAKDLHRKHPRARYTAEILEITGGGTQTIGCNIELDIIQEEKPSNGQRETGEAVVYVDKNSKKYHDKPNCSGMTNPKSMPLSQAKKKYTACKKCYK